MLLHLTKAQQNAFDRVHRRAAQNRRHNLERSRQVLAASGVQYVTADLIAAIRRIARISVNFHPDRLMPDGRSVIAALYEDGIYRSQFETRISNGGLTAFPGGDRDHWEEAMFGSAYQAEGVTEAERPKYGGLNLMNYSNGACPRFGSCYIQLKPAALDRSTFTFGDSVTNPQDIGVIDAFESVLAGLLEEIASSGNALGRKGVDVATFITALLNPNSEAGQGLFRPTQGRDLDNYIEAQLHGALNMDRDVDKLVADPSFQGTATGDLLQATASKYNFELRRHSGVELTLAEVAVVPVEFKGPEMLPLAAKVLENHSLDHEHLDAAAIGSAAVSVVVSPEQWQDWGSPKDTLQLLKYLWHVLVVYGMPRETGE